MLPNRSRKGTKKKAVWTPQNPRFPGIVRHAAELGVTRIHLYFVLRGDRVSPGLLRRYHQILKQESLETQRSAQ